MYSKGMILASAIRQVRGLGDNKFEVVTSLRTFTFRAEREGTASASLTFFPLHLAVIVFSLLVSGPLSLRPSDSLSGLVFLSPSLLFSLPLCSPLPRLSHSSLAPSQCLGGNLTSQLTCSFLSTCPKSDSVWLEVPRHSKIILARYPCVRKSSAFWEIGFFSEPNMRKSVSISSPELGFQPIIA